MDEHIETQLIRQSREGDSQAFADLMEAHHENVYALAFRLSGTPEGADELTQDTFVQAFRCLREFQGRSRFMTWLYAITTRKAMDRRRGSRSVRKTFSLNDKSDMTEDARRPGPVDMVEALHEKELAGLLSNAVMMLPPDQQAALTLVVQEGLSYRDAARTLACAEGTVAWRVWKARQTLWGKLGRYLKCI